MSAQFARAPHQGRAAQLSSPPHTALLIDFDNVTMGIRSDLTKELKNLLNSDIIKGKVAVQRAYADWRRYPQYIVPLAESSVDLIFAPAYGSAKKNATDIRLAIDALELVFVRPEIGSFILLSGDSDFSSLVLKLKEYGKYVIGVGIRESASDLLVQNCDEYYSYSALTGLTRAGEEVPVASEDPWELVDLALRQMTENEDVMRSDRLKQVLLELDPSFDEKSLGFTKFNKFLQEAANRGLLSLRKQENGQFEIATADAPAGTAEEDEQRSRRRRGGRGRRGREEREQPAVAAAAEKETARAAASEEPAPAGKKRARQPAVAAEQEQEPDRKPASEPAPGEPVGTGLDAAFALLRRAAQDAQRASDGGAARDSDVKRRLLELDPDWDEGNLGFSKFSRFLRRAHEDDVVTLHRLDNGNYEVAPGVIDSGDEGRARRGRGRDRDEQRAPRARRDESRSATPQDDGAGKPSRDKPAAATKPAVKTGEAAAAAGKQIAAQSTTFEESAAGQARPAQPIGLRRGSRSRGGKPSGPPPLFEGQTLSVGNAGARQEPAAVAATPDWFPTERAALLRHLSSYDGVGRKTAEQLADTFTVDGVYSALSSQQEQVRELLGPRRSDALLTAFEAEHANPPVPVASRQSAARPGRSAVKKTARKTVKNTAGKQTAAPVAKKQAARKSSRKSARKSARGAGAKPTPVE